MVVQAGVLSVSLVFAKGALSEASKARELQATREILSEIGGEDIRSARSWVLKENEMDDPANLTEEQRKKAKKVAVSLDRVAYMVRQGLVPEYPLFVWQRDEIVELWGKLKPVVAAEWGRRPNYCLQFKWLAEEWLPEMQKKNAN